MMPRGPGRAIALALAFLLAGLGSLCAHPLPGSTLTFWQEDRVLNLSITTPLEDLIIATPKLEGLERHPLEQALPDESLGRVAAYFAAHLNLEQGAGSLALKLTRATLQADEHADVGRYKVLVVHLMAPLDAIEELFPLTLTYDAVMHEVRNHRATVFWATPAGTRSRLANFGYQATKGTVVLRLP